MDKFALSTLVKTPTLESLKTRSNTLEKWACLEHMKTADFIITFKYEANIDALK